MPQIHGSPDSGLQLASPASTPEPYAEQHSVALAAETGDIRDLDVILNHFGTTGAYIICLVTLHLYFYSYRCTLLTVIATIILPN